MSLWAVVPAKDPALGKTRLAPYVGKEHRIALALAALDRVLEALVGSHYVERILVVSSATSIHERATRLGAEPIDEPRAGHAMPEATARDEMLNRAIAAAVAVTLGGGASGLLVMAGDLPLADSHSIDALVAAAPDRGLAIVADRHQSGTNALLLRPPDAIATSFGRESFSRHLLRARDSGIAVEVCAMAQLALDIDRPSDLWELRARLRSTTAAGQAPGHSDVELLTLVDEALAGAGPDRLAAPARCLR